MSGAVERVLAALGERGLDPTRSGEQWSFQCPAHDDRNPSATLAEGDDHRALIMCHAGCSTESLVAALGLRKSDLFDNPSGPLGTIVEIYDYTDETETLLFQTVRFEPKAFRQRRPGVGAEWVWNLKDARRVLYGLPRLLETVKNGGTVYVVEGEKDADSINLINRDLAGAIAATCNPLGAGKWRKDFNEVLRGARVVIIADKDEPGRKHARDIALALQGVAATVEVVEAKTGKDVSDHLAAGHSLADLLRVEPAELQPVAAAPRGWRSVGLRSLLASDAPPIPWLVEGIVARNECVILTADAKSGKTWLLLALVLDAALGRPVWGKFTSSSSLRVLWIDEEMGTQKLGRRIQRLVRGIDLSDADIDGLDERVDIRPQQGFRLASDAGIRELHKVAAEFQPQLVVIDSLPAVQGGEENSNSDRRDFYNRVIAPIKSEFDCGVILTAHPPLPSRDAHVDAKKRPRGGGDALAFIDRTYWLEKGRSTKTAHGYVHQVTFREHLSREGGGVESQSLLIEDGPEGATIVRPGTVEKSSTEAQDKVSECADEIVRVLKAAPNGRMYQPDLVRRLEDRGFDREHVYYPAIRDLTAGGTIKKVPAPEGSGDRGKWIELIEAGGE